MSALGMASLGTQCTNRALGMATLGSLCTTEVSQPAVDKGGAHRKHLWRPLREASTPEVSVSGITRVAFSRPIVAPASVGTITPTYEHIEARARVGMELPTTGAKTPAVSTHIGSRVGVATPSCHAATRYCALQQSTAVNVLAPVAFCVTPEVSARGKTYYAFWTPETVQNPTPEMLSLL